jgi:hypothetical protein
MIRRIARQDPPNWTGWPKSYRIDQWRTDFQRTFDVWTRNLSRYLVQQIGEIVDQVNTQLQGRGPDLDSDEEIVITHPIHRVSGSGTIINVIPPEAQLSVDNDYVTTRRVSSFTGPIFLIPAAGSTWTLDDSGNVYKTAAAVPGQVLMIVFDGEKWAPSL